MKKFLVILLLVFITSGIAVAYAPSLKIRDTDLDCDEDYSMVGMTVVLLVLI